MATELIVLLSLTILYFLAVLSVIVYSRVKSTGSITPGLNEYFLAGRNINVFVLLATYIGSLFSAAFALALPGFVFSEGLGGGVYVVAGDAIGVIFILTFYKTFRAFSQKHQTYSPMETLSVAYNSKTIGLVCAILMMFFLCPYISMQLVGMGKFLEGLSDGQIGYAGGVGVMMAIVAAYLIFGGMRAVAYTDFIQTICIFIGIFGSMFFFISINWDSIGALFEQAAQQTPKHLSLPGPNDYFTPPIFITMSIFAMAILFQPQFMTRAMMAKDDKQLDVMGFGLLIALLIGMLPVFVFGVGGAVLFGDDVESNQVLGRIFKMITDYSFLGLIFTGFMLIGALGAAMSTADSILLSIGQMFSRDVAAPYMKINEKSQVLLAKVIMMIVLVGAFVMGLRPPEIMAELVIYSISATCILIPTILGFQWKYRSVGAALTSIIISTIVLAYLGFTKTKPLGMHEGFLTLVTSGAVFYVIGKLSGVRNKNAVQDLASGENS